MELIVHKTGNIVAYGSDTEGLFPSFERNLRKRSAKDALQSLWAACEKLSPPKQATVETKATEASLAASAKCDKTPTMITDDPMTCTATAMGVCTSRRKIN